MTFSADYDDYWWFASYGEGVPILGTPSQDTIQYGVKARRCCEPCAVEWESEDITCWSCGAIGQLGYISRKNLTESGVMVPRTETWVGDINRSCQLEADADLSMPATEVQ